MDYKQIENIKQFANYLRCDVEFIQSILQQNYFVIENVLENLSFIFDKMNSDKVFIEKFYIPKKNKKSGFRTIYKPLNHNLSNTLKILNNYLSSIYNPLENVHGFVNGRSIKTNATKHLAKKIILTIDIKDFFESISKQAISAALIELGFKIHVTEWISTLTTINNFLTQGFHTSPTIANIVAQKMDIELNRICGDSICYTRYADDLYFSSNDTIPELEKYKSIVESYGFLLNDSKTKLMRRGQNQYVTGLSVFDNKLPRIPKKIKRNLRLEIYYITRFGYEAHAIRKLGLHRNQLNDIGVKGKIIDEMEKTSLRIWGWIHYIQSIETEYGNKLHDKLKNDK